MPLNHNTASAVSEKEKKAEYNRKRRQYRQEHDHVMPLKLGGQHVIENIQLLCPSCNHKKSAMHPDKWAAKLGKLFV